MRDLIFLEFFTEIVKINEFRISFDLKFKRKLVIE